MKIVKRQMLLHHSVSAIGGFVGGYTIYNHSDIFVNAQTGNLIKLVHNVCDGRLGLVALMALSFLTYAAGCVFYAVMRKYIKISMKIVSFIVTTAAVAAVGIMSGIENDFFAVLPLIFAMPVQWNAFKTAGGNSSATTFSSNNVRQAVMLLTKFIMERNKKDLRNSAFYWRTLLCFHIGVAASCLLSLWLGVQSIWFCLAFIAASGFLYYRYESAKIQAFGELRADN